jgi:hypothetical protein
VVAEPRTPPAGRASPGEGFLTSSLGVPSVLQLEEPSEEDLDADHDDTPLHLRSMNDVVDAVTPPWYAVRTLAGEDECLHIISAEEPSSVAQATQEVVWCKAMKEEL